MTWIPYPDPALADQTVSLRPWAETDIACVSEGKGVDEDGAREWIGTSRRRQTDGAGLTLAIADARTGEALGAVGLLYRPTPGTVPVASSAEAGPPGLVFRPDPGSAGIGYWVLERARGRGLASSAVSLLVEWAFDRAQLHRVEALVEPDNIASQRVLQRARFEREGRLRSYLPVPEKRTDALIYARVRDPSEAY